MKEGDILIVEHVEVDNWDKENQSGCTLVSLRPFRATIQRIRPTAGGASHD